LAGPGSAGPARQLARRRRRFGGATLGSRPRGGPPFGRRVPNVQIPPVTRQRRGDCARRRQRGCSRARMALAGLGTRRATATVRSTRRGAPSRRCVRRVLTRRTPRRARKITCCERCARRLGGQRPKLAAARLSQQDTSDTVVLGARIPYCKRREIDGRSPEHAIARGDENTPSGHPANLRLVEF